MMNLSWIELLIVLLVMVLVAVLSYWLLTRFVSDDVVSKKKLNQILNQDSVTSVGIKDKETLRKQGGNESMGFMSEERGAYRSASITLLLRQANINLTSTAFMLLSMSFGTCLCLYVYFAGWSPLISAGLWVIASFGLPRFLLRFLLKRRQNQFLHEFPNVLDLIVRGVKSGIPVNDSFQMIAVDGPEPIRSEFSKVLEKQIVGVPLATSMVELYKSVPLTEVMFLAIVIQIQSESGGSLSAALTNLSKVLRNRTAMKGKVQALSQEAKASAVIIGLLPVLVGVALWFVSPEYLDTLLFTSTGQLMLTISSIWMMLGILVMKKMINFQM